MYDGVLRILVHLDRSLRLARKVKTLKPKPRVEESEGGSGLQGYLAHEKQRPPSTLQ